MEDIGKRLKLEEEKEADRISSLPDSIVQRILSFLPSIKQAIRCGILSKRWRDQWTRLPILILDPTGMSNEHFLKFTDNILISYDCFKIKKFCITYLHSFVKDPQFLAKIRFATRRNVEELNLVCGCVIGKYMLPDFLFNCASLVKLQTRNCMFMPIGSVNWEHLKDLSLRFCTLPNQTIKSVSTGSPLLESLELFFCDGFDQPIIASKSLRRVKVASLESFAPEISCPNLDELYVVGENVSFSNLAIENVLSTSHQLKSLTLDKCDIDGFKLVISTESLRTLVLRKLKVSVIEISCPNLEKLNLQEVDNVGRFEFKNVPSSISAPSDFSVSWTTGSVQWRRFSSNMQPSRT